MATSFTTNLRLILTDDLTPEARANLQRIDALGVVFQLTSTGDVYVRSAQNIIIEPQAASLGGDGQTGDVTIGTASHSIDSLAVYADAIGLNGDVSVPVGKIVNINGDLQAESIKLMDDANDNYLELKSPAVMTANLTYILPGTDGIANQVLSTDGAGNLFFATVATASLFQHNMKVGNASNIEQAVDTNAVGDILADSSLGLNIKSNVIVDADVNAAAAITLSKLAALSNNVAVQTNGSGILSSSSVTSTELGYVSGVTSAIQTQLNAKEPTITTLPVSKGGTGSSTALNNNRIMQSSAGTIIEASAITASRALISDSNGIPTQSATTSAELAFISGVTSAIQTQLNAKQPLDATLTSLAAYNTNGLLTQTAADTFTGRTITAGTGISVSNGDGVAGNPTITSSVTQYTDEMAQDAVGSILTDTSSVDFTYDDAGNAISAVVLPAGVNHNLLLNYVANQHIDHSTVSISAGTGLSGGGDITTSRTISMPNTGTAGTYGSASQVPVFTTDVQGRVSSVTNTTISVTSTSISDFNEAAQDAVGNILTDTASVDFTYSDAGNTISAAVLPAGVDHNSLQNFVANKHIDHSGVNIVTGSTSGLSGGGDITASRTLLVAPDLATSTTVASGDLLLVADVSASNVLRNVTAGSIAALGGSSFTATWLAADGTTKAITHSLGTRDIMVQVYDNTNFDTIYVDTVIRTSTSVVTLTSSEAPSVSWRVLIRAQ